MIIIILILIRKHNLSGINNLIFIFHKNVSGVRSLLGHTVIILPRFCGGVVLTFCIVATQESSLI